MNEASASSLHLFSPSSFNQLESTRDEGAESSFLLKPCMKQASISNGRNSVTKGRRRSMRKLLIFMSKFLIFGCSFWGSEELNTPPPLHLKLIFFRFLQTVSTSSGDSLLIIAFAYKCPTRSYCPSQFFTEDSRYITKAINAHTTNTTFRSNLSFTFLATFATFFSRRILSFFLFLKRQPIVIA